ncbi:MAG TPA: GLUG motif-containing protein [Rhizomicrobium sp.]|nr:GLUG motif-containing protein [Rhizomicrobium sp.]
MSVPPASAAVIVSTAATQNMVCATGVCSPTAVDAVLSANDLEALLSSGNAAVITTGSGVQADDIRIEARVSWSSANMLTLDAHKSVTIDRSMKASGAGGLSVITDDGGSGGEFAFEHDGSLTFRDLSSALLINGTAYQLVGSVAALAGAIAAKPSGAFALANTYDASGDGTYSVSPVSTVLTGAFNGLGNTIANLTINDPTENAYVGLFAEISSNATLNNLTLTNLNVTGGSGTSDAASTECVGGLVGFADGGVIAHVAGNGAVTAGQYASVGGLLGIGDGTIESSVANISVSNGLLGNAGGLVGGADGLIADSYATGNVSGSGFVGGLVGFNYTNAVEHSYATGAVTGSDASTYAGGLAGINESGFIDRSYSSATVSCEFVCGGLVGIEGFGSGIPGVSRSFATGSVTANVTETTLAGGLVGFNQTGRILNSYASGAVSAMAAGGLVGQNENYPGGYRSISRSYASAAVRGAIGYTGGLIGFDDNEFGNTIERTYWDTTTSGITNLSQGAGNISNDPGIKGLSNTKLQAELPRGFNPRVWTENADINGGLPYLVANPPGK